MSVERHAPLNLTAAAERIPWPEVYEALHIPGDTSGRGLAIRGLDLAEGGPLSDDQADIVYVIAAGYSVLHCGNAPIEFTNGDVLFVPRGHWHRFPQMNGGTRIWRTSVATAAAGSPE